MKKINRDPTRFNRGWNPKRIALIFFVQIGKEYRNGGSVDVGKINDKNYLKHLSSMEDGPQRDALAWFADEWSEKTFSFNWVCDVLEISRADYRKRVLRGDIVEEIAKLQVAIID